MLGIQGSEDKYLTLWVWKSRVTQITAVSLYVARLLVQYSLNYNTLKTTQHPTIFPKYCDKPFRR